MRPLSARAPESAPERRTKSFSNGRTGARRLLVGALLVFAACAALAGGAIAVLLWTAWGRAHVCSLLNRAVTAQIAGRLQVERIDALSLTQVTASGIKIFPPTGEAAIEAEHAVIDFSPRKLWAGEFGWSRADISHCLVRVTEDKNQHVNMEDTFAKRKSPGQDSQHETPESDSSSDLLDLQSMVTSDCTLLIGGHELPSLKMTKLAGIMRVHVLGNGDTELRFDRYKGTFVKGLPTGVLEFHDVFGEVVTAGKRLLRFSGLGRTRGEKVAFELDIATKPEQQVKIDAVFPKHSLASLRTECVALWSEFSKSLELTVHYE